MARINVTDVLNRIKIEDLTDRTEPFYITDITVERGERGRKASPDDATGEMYAFRVVSEDGEVIGNSKTATLGLMEQIDSFLQHGGPDDEYGPMLIEVVGKARRFVPVKPNVGKNGK